MHFECRTCAYTLPLTYSDLDGGLFEEPDARAWIKAHGVPAEPAAGRRKDADRGTGW